MGFLKIKHSLDNLRELLYKISKLIRKQEEMKHCIIDAGIDE